MLQQNTPKTVRNVLGGRNLNQYVNKQMDTIVDLQNAAGNEMKSVE